MWKRCAGGVSGIKTGHIIVIYVVIWRDDEMKRYCMMEWLINCKCYIKMNHYMMITMMMLFHNVFLVNTAQAQLLYKSSKNYGKLKEL